MEIIGENKQSTSVNKEDLTKQKEKKSTLEFSSFEAKNTVAENDDKLLEIIEDFERGQDKKKDTNSNSINTYAS